MIIKWSDALDDPDIDGIAIDEFYSHDPFVETWMKSFNEVLFDTWAEALETVRKRYPDKLIMVWMWGWGEHSKPILESINKYADYWTLKSNIVSEQELNQVPHAQQAIPTSISWQQPTSIKNNTVITLIWPHFDQTTKKAYSVGTRFTLHDH